MKTLDKKIFLIVFVILIFSFFYGFSTKLEVTHYTITSSKIENGFTITLVADLHSCYYGEELFYAIDESDPDYLMLAGDIIDDAMPLDYAIDFFENIQGKYPTYYVSGNHEFWSNEIDMLKEIVNSYDIKILEGEIISIGDKIVLAGVDDVCVGDMEFENQLNDVSDNVSESDFSILLSHRPEKYADYTAFDLVLSGHAHGGQWRIPIINQGIYAPNQGFFPKYSGGFYEFENMTMIVSRGLAKESTRIPRIFNRPELVIINVVPQ